MVGRRIEFQWFLVGVLIGGNIATAQGPGPAIPRTCPGGACPVNPIYGHYPTQWRRWPGVPLPPVPTRPERVPTPEPTETKPKAEQAGAGTASEGAQSTEPAPATPLQQGAPAPSDTTEPPAQQPAPSTAPSTTVPTLPAPETQPLPQGTNLEKLFPETPPQAEPPSESQAPPNSTPPSEAPSGTTPESAPKVESGLDTTKSETSNPPDDSTSVAPGPVDDPFPDDPLPPPPGVEASPASLPRTRPEASGEERTGMQWGRVRSFGDQTEASDAPPRQLRSTLRGHRQVAWSWPSPRRPNPLRGGQETDLSRQVVPTAYTTDVSGQTVSADNWRANPLRTN